MMTKIVRKYGNSLVITFDRQDKEIFGIEEGDIVEISDIVVVSKAKANNIRKRTYKPKRK